MMGEETKKQRETGPHFERVLSGSEITHGHSVEPRGNRNGGETEGWTGKKCRIGKQTNMYNVIRGIRLIHEVYQSVADAIHTPRRLIVFERLSLSCMLQGNK
jgi:hypothetical protein